MTNKQLLENLAWAFIHYKTSEFKTERDREFAYQTYKRYKDEAMKRMSGE